MARAEIASKQAIHTLLQLHAELGGKIVENKKEHGRLAEAMRHVESVIKMLKPGFSVRSIAIRRRKTNPWFKRGTIFRLALEVLKSADRPLSAGEITKAMLEAKGVIDASKKALDDLTGGVLASLRNNKGKLVVAHGSHPTRWSIE